MCNTLRSCLNVYVLYCLVTLTFDHLQEKFEKLVLGCAAGKAEPEATKSLWNSVKDRMYSLDVRHKELGLGEKVFEHSYLMYGNYFPHLQI